MGLPAVCGPRPVNNKRVWRVRREQHLLVPPHVRLQATRPPPGSPPNPTQPNAWGGSELPQVVVEGVGGVDVVIGLEG